jgi:hypothetical protein
MPQSALTSNPAQLGSPGSTSSTSNKVTLAQFAKSKFFRVPLGSELTSYPQHPWVAPGSGFVQQPGSGPFAQGNSPHPPCPADWMHALVDPPVLVTPPVPPTPPVIVGCPPVPPVG